jgi:hypothetical protein
MIKYNKQKGVDLKGMIENVLEIEPETRNSDIALMIEIWKRYFSEYLFNTLDCAVFLNDLYKLPREDHIKRIRADFNSRGMYLPTDPQVIKQRRINIDKWKEQLGYK